MESKVTKYSAAAVIALAITLVLVNPFGNSKYGGVVLADVKKKIDEVDSMILGGKKVYSHADDPNIILQLVGDITFDFDIVKYISKQHGYTEKGYQNDKLVYRITFNVPKKQTIVVLPPWKKYIKFPCTDEQLKVMEMLTPNGIFDMLLQSGYEELGMSNIDGVEVQGFAFEDVEVLKGIFPKVIFDIQKCKGSAWVGVEELLPVRMEADIKVGKSFLTLFNDLNLHEVNVLKDYNVELGEENFDTNIPEGYTELTLSDFIPVKASLVGLGIGSCMIPAGFIFWRRRRKKKMTDKQH